MHRTFLSLSCKLTHAHQLLCVMETTSTCRITQGTLFSCRLPCLCISKNFVLTLVYMSVSYVDSDNPYSHECDAHDVHSPTHAWSRKTQVDDTRAFCTWGSRQKSVAFAVAWRSKWCTGLSFIHEAQNSSWNKADCPAWKFCFFSSKQTRIGRAQHAKMDLELVVYMYVRWWCSWNGGLSIGPFFNFACVCSTHNVHLTFTNTRPSGILKLRMW